MKSCRQGERKFMLVKLLGISRVDFKSQSGDHIEGHKLYTCFEDENVKGFKTDAFFVRKEIALPDVKLNDEVNIYFNSKGKVEAVTK